MNFPPARYENPVFANSAQFDWAEIAEGVGEKLLGVFTERRTEASLLRLDKGARHEVAGHGLWVALDGSGRVGGEPMRQYSALFLDKGETTRIDANETTQLLHYGLPELGHLVEKRSPSAMAAE